MSAMTKTERSDRACLDLVAVRVLGACRKRA